MAKKPNALRPGDRVAIVSPSSATTPDKLANGITLLESRGYVPVIGKHTYDVDGFLAGKDEDRAADLVDAWFDDSIAGIILARGGYGMNRLLPRLPLDDMANRPKLLVGFSDATALHLALNQRGLPTLYAPMVLSYAKERATWVSDLWFAAMEGQSVSLPAAAPLGETVVSGSAEAVVTGGCLCLLTDSLGTPTAFNGSGKIILIEDVDEHAYRVDAMLTHLLAAGALDRVAGIVVGEMTGTDKQEDGSIPTRSWREVVVERLAPLSVPMVVNYPFGHSEHMASLPLGVRARFDADAGEVEYLEPVADV